MNARLFIAGTGRRGDGFLPLPVRRT
jgi:hypothetical protein